MAEFDGQTWVGNYCENTDSCLFCGSRQFGVGVPGVEDWFFNNVPGAFDLVKCGDCGSYWLPTRLAPSHLPLAYATYYTHAPDAADERPRSKLQQAYIRHRYCGSRSLVDRVGAAVYRTVSRHRQHLDAIYRFAPPAPARILDYGCGGGEFLRFMKAQGYDVTGVDFDPVALDRLRGEGIAAFTPDQIDLSTWEGQFDCVTLAHVIEHVTDPAELLRTVRSILKPGGILYLEAPNADSEGVNVFGKYWRGLEVPRHLAIPTRHALEDMLKREGFRPGQWILRDWIRSWVWPASLKAVPEAERGAIEAKMKSAPVETLDNAEYLIVVTEKA